ncbi:DUF3626 domain-containing protein [Spirilliplanes yamanashiensis]
MRAAARSAGATAPADLLAAVRAHARVTVHFHPDRVAADGGTVAEGLARDGRYRSQFETGISNGGLTAYPGGDRDRWEHRLFGGAYTGGPAADRPVYGALDLAGHPDGAAPRFGSCHLRLTAAALHRCTFAAADSVTEPAELGTIDAFAPVLAALLARPRACGVADLAAALRAPGPRPDAGRCLDDYVEAHVHGGLDLGRDVAAVVADPSLRGTAAGAALAGLARRYGVPLRCHPGFALPPADVPAGFRDPRSPRLAAHVCDRAGSGLLTAAVIGAAAASAVRDPGGWAAWGPPAEVLQQLKYLWHVLVAFGHPYPG